MRQIKVVVPDDDLDDALAVNLSAVAVLWYLGYRPPDWADANGLAALRQEWETVAVVVLLVGLLVGASTLLAAPVGFERDATHAVADVLSSPPYDEVELIRVRADVGVGIGPGPADGASVTVVTTRPADTEYPELATRVATAIATETGREVAVVVEFSDLSRAPPPSASDAGSSRGMALPRRGVDAGGVEGMHPGTGIS